MCVYGINGTHPVIYMKVAMHAKHDILGTNGGTSRLEMGQPSIEPSTKLEVRSCQSTGHQTTHWSGTERSDWSSTDPHWDG